MLKAWKILASSANLWRRLVQDEGENSSTLSSVHNTLANPPLVPSL